MHSTGIYEIKNTVNGKRYVGSAVDFGNRWRIHAQSLVRGDHHSAALQRAWRHYGPRAFQFNKLLACSKENLLLYEQACMDALKPEYNCAPKAGSQLGFKHSKESCEKMRVSRLAYEFKPWLGKQRSDETKAKISANRKGKGGGPMSEDRRSKISAANKGRIITPEQRQKISASLEGHKQSASQIEKRKASMPPGHYERSALAKRKLTESQVREVRALLSGGVSHRQIGATFGVSHSVIADISCGRRYGGVL